MPMAMSTNSSLSPTNSSSGGPAGPGGGFGGGGGGANEKGRIGQDANMWNTGFEGMMPEADDYLHNPDPKRDRKVSNSSLASGSERSEGREVGDGRWEMG